MITNVLSPFYGSQCVFLRVFPLAELIKLNNDSKLIIIIIIIIIIADYNLM